jgi:hypothetical protein
MEEDYKKLLQVVLANGRMSVHDIAAEARAAGLLGATKEISQSTPCRTACHELGVIHTREGFGPGAVYYWSLP